MDNKNTTKETLWMLSYNSTGCNESKLLYINKWHKTVILYLFKSAGFWINNNIN